MWLNYCLDRAKLSSKTRLKLVKTVLHCITDILFIITHFVFCAYQNFFKNNILLIFTFLTFPEASNRNNKKRLIMLILINVNSLVPCDLIFHSSGQLEAYIWKYFYRRCFCRAIYMRVRVGDESLQKQNKTKIKF